MDMQTVPGDIKSRLVFAQVRLFVALLATVLPDTDPVERAACLLDNNISESLSVLSLLPSLVRLLSD